VYKLASKLDRIDELKKTCHKCNKKTPISMFYSNKDWKHEFYHDAWCKECVRKFCTSADRVKDYCKYNRREYRHDLWEWCYPKAEEELNRSSEYRDNRDLNEKVKILTGKQFNWFFRMMNRVQWYKFIDEFGEVKEREDIGMVGKIPEDDDLPFNEMSLELEYGEKKYSPIWHGFYTVGELNYLETYFAGLERDFKLENSAYIDYAKKVCKASLAMDKAFSDMCEGHTGAEKRYKDFKDIFDQLSQSAKFAEKTRTENDSIGLGSFGELTKKLETTGFLQKKITFKKDEIDAIINDFRWIIASIGEDI